MIDRLADGWWFDPFTYTPGLVIDFYGGVTQHLFPLVAQNESLSSRLMLCDMTSYNYRVTAVNPLAARLKTFLSLNFPAIVSESIVSVCPELCTVRDSLRSQLMNLKYLREKEKKNVSLLDLPAALLGCDVDPVLVKDLESLLFTSPLAEMLLMPKGSVFADDALSAGCIYMLFAEVRPGQPEIKKRQQRLIAHFLLRSYMAAMKNWRQKDAPLSVIVSGAEFLSPFPWSELAMVLKEKRGRCILAANELAAKDAETLKNSGALQYNNDTYLAAVCQPSYMLSLDYPGYSVLSVPSTDALRALSNKKSGARPSFSSEEGAEDE